MKKTQIEKLLNDICEYIKEISGMTPIKVSQYELVCDTIINTLESF